MPNNASALQTYFAKLGLETDMADLYLTLHAHGPQTITGLARLAGIERTRVYRLLDKLTSANLVEIENQYKRVILHAAPITNLQILLSKREQDVRNLQEELHLIHGKLNNTPQNHLTRVQFYRGDEGNKQMFWNQTKAKGETLAILHETMQTKTNLAFFERWVRKCNERGQHFRGIVGDHFMETLQSWYSANSNERLKFWEARYVPPEIFPITHSAITYDDVLGYYNWRDGEVFGVELYNQEIAQAQRHTFEILWKQAEPITDDLNWKPKQKSP